MDRLTAGDGKIITEAAAFFEPSQRDLCCFTGKLLGSPPNSQEVEALLSPLEGEKTEVQGSEGLSQVALYNDPLLLASTLQGALRS